MSVPDSAPSFRLNGPPIRFVVDQFADGKPRVSIREYDNQEQNVVARIDLNLDEWMKLSGYKVFYDVDNAMSGDILPDRSDGEDYDEATFIDESSVVVKVTPDLIIEVEHPDVTEPKVTLIQRSVHLCHPPDGKISMTKYMWLGFREISRDIKRECLSSNACRMDKNFDVMYFD